MNVEKFDNLQDLLRKTFAHEEVDCIFLNAEFLTMEFGFNADEAKEEIINLGYEVERAEDPKGLGVLVAEDVEVIKDFSEGKNVFMADFNRIRS